MPLPPGFTEIASPATASNGGAPPAGFTEIKQDYPGRRAFSKYLVHPVIEGGAMTLGGMATAPLAPETLGIAPVAAAAAMYPPAHEAANAVDDLMGIGGRKQPISDLKRVLGETQTGLNIEAGGKVLGAAGKAVSEIPFAKFMEGASGSPANNFRRTFKKGFSVYNAEPLEKAGEEFGVAKRNLVGMLTPEEQADILVNPSGAASERLKETVVKWLKGQEIDPKDALLARQAADRLFPSDTAKNATQRGGLADFKTYMNEILGKQEEGLVPYGVKQPLAPGPAMKEKSDQFADSMLRSQILQPLRVNKSNPNEVSKLGLMLNGPLAGVLAGHGDFGTAITSLVAQSPAFYGFVSALAGQLNKILPSMSPESQQALARGLFSSFKTSQEQSQ